MSVVQLMHASHCFRIIRAMLPPPPMSFPANMFCRPATQPSTSLATSASPGRCASSALEPCFFSARSVSTRHFPRLKLQTLHIQTLHPALHIVRPQPSSPELTHPPHAKIFSEVGAAHASATSDADAGLDSHAAMKKVGHMEAQGGAGGVGARAVRQVTCDTPWSGGGSPG
jgi:hypothetical protein